MTEGQTLIVILHFGTINDTVECLRSLECFLSSPFDVLVINNGPDADVEPQLRTACPDVIYREAGVETGFAAGNNIGLKLSLAQGYCYTLLLNNDTVAEQDFLLPLIDILERIPEVAMAGPAMYHYDNPAHLWSCGGWINRWSGSMAGNRTMDSSLPPLSDVDYLPGACVLVRNESLGSIGLLSEEYFLGVEEADWACQARRLGFRVVASSDSILLHKVGVSSRFTPELIYNSFRNRFLFLRRQFRFPLRLLLPIALLGRRLFADPAERTLCLRAFWDHCKYESIRREHLEAVKSQYAIAKQGVTVSG
ncbi:MAG: glycosyltransferase [Chthoniobacterales bacterium]